MEAEIGPEVDVQPPGDIAPAVPSPRERRQRPARTRGGGVTRQRAAHVGWDSTTIFAQHRGAHAERRPCIPPQMSIRPLEAGCLGDAEPLPRRRGEAEAQGDGRGVERAHQAAAREGGARAERTRRARTGWQPSPDYPANGDNIQAVQQHGPASAEEAPLSASLQKPPRQPARQGLGA